jgi:hypothetical protein
MLVTNFKISERARLVLDRRKSLFKPGPHGAFALSYTSSFTNPDGSTVAGFVPGWQVCAIGHKYLGRDPLLVMLPNGTTFHLMPRDGWEEREQYLMDLLSLDHEVYSITPDV